MKLRNLLPSTPPPIPASEKAFRKNVVDAIVARHKQDEKDKQAEQDKKATR